MVSGRDDPGPPWHKIRLGGVVELHGSDLAFEHAEARKLLAHAFGRVLPDDQLAELCRLTEGWAAGLCLAGLALRDSSSPQSSDSSRVGRHPYVRDFLEIEVLDKLPDDQVHFLEATSVLDRLDPELCDVLTDRSDSEDLLEHFVEMNLFTGRISDSPVRFRYHALFAEFLRGRLDRSKDLDRASLLTTASQWYEDRGMMDAAITAVLETGDFDRAERMIGAACGPAIRSGLATTVVRWVSALPAEAIERSPDLSVVLARASASRGDLLIARTALEAARRSHERRPVSWLGLGIAHLDFLVRVLDGSLSGVVEDIEEALRILTAEPDQPVLAMFGIDEEATVVYGAVAKLLTGQLNSAVAATDQA